MPTILELYTELSARGFDYLVASGRAKQMVIDAIAQLESEAVWPWLVTETDATASGNGVLVTLTTEDRVQGVYDQAQRRTLTKTTFEDLRDSFGDLTTRGTPQYWYIYTDSNGTAFDPTISLRVYPAVSSGTFTYRTSTITRPSDDAETWFGPRLAVLVILNMATQMAYRDADNHQAAEALQIQIDRDLLNLRMRAFSDQGPGADDYVYVTEAW